MTASAEAASDRRRTRRGLLAEVLVALACFAVLCGAALSRPVELLEPDDYAYRASIVALSEGHIVLTDEQYQDLRSRLRTADGTDGTGTAGGSSTAGGQSFSNRGGPGGLGGGISQWTQLKDGRWVSEKNPGYPFLAVPFHLLGIGRAAPLFYGALGCFALFAGGRRWLGAWGGTWAVGLFCSSGAAMVFAWRAWMPTFAGAALVAAGAGALLWTLLAADVNAKRRTAAGLLGFLALEGAMLMRYTDVVALGVAVAAVLLVRRFSRGRIPRWALVWWLASAALAGLIALGWNQTVYGGALSTGYAAGVVTFGLGAIPGNLANMPWKLVAAMPASLLALGGLVWLVGRSVRLRLAGQRDTAPPSRSESRRDLAVAAALAAAWAGNWALYFTYYWTAQMSGGGPGDMGSSGGTGGAIHVIRFFVPALASIALLSAWPLARLPRWLAGAVVAGFFGLGLWSFAGMAATPAGGGPGPNPGGGPGAPPSGGLPPGAPTTTP